MKKILYIPLSILLLWSCEKVIPMPDVYTENKLAINGIMSPNDYWKIEVSGSINILDNDDPPLIEDATVTITDSKGESEVLKHTKNGRYTSINYPIAGETYTMTASHPDYKSVQTSFSIPQSPEIKALKQGGDKYFDYSHYNSINVTIKDNPGNDYYSLRVFKRYQFPYWDPITDTPTDSIIEQKDQIGIAITDNTEEVFEGTRYYTTYYFSDEFFNGQDYTLHIYIYDNNYNSMNMGMEGDVDLSGVEFVTVLDTSKYYIELSSITKDMYLYTKSIENYSMSRDNPFAQPAQIYTNIENGYGLLSGYNLIEDSLLLFTEQEYPLWEEYNPDMYY